MWQAQLSQKEEKLQGEIDELRTNLAQIDQSLKMRERTVAESRDKMAAIGRKLSGLGSGGSALEGLQKELTSSVRGGWWGYIRINYEVTNIGI